MKKQVLSIGLEGIRGEPIGVKMDFLELGCTKITLVSKSLVIGQYLNSHIDNLSIIPAYKN
jgi:hypothetical protein